MKNLAIIVSAIVFVFAAGAFEPVFGQCNLGAEILLPMEPPFVLCPGENITITGNPIGGTGPYTYEWLDGQTTQSITITTPWVGGVQLEITDAEGCMATVYLHIKTYTWSIGIYFPFEQCSGAELVTYPAFPNGTNFLWSTGETTANIIALNSGTYTVTATSPNGNCSATASNTVTIPPATAPDISGPSILCPGGDNTVTLTNAIFYNNYTWSTGATTSDITVTTPGTYTVTVTEGADCTATGSITIGSGLSLTGVPSPMSSCDPPNGAIDITITPPTGPYTIEWSNGDQTEDINDLAAGTYTVTVTDLGGCSATGSYTINSNLVLPTPSSITTPATCGQSDGAVNLSVVPRGAYTYAWSSGEVSEDLNAVPSGTYTVTVTSLSSGCTATLSAIVPNNSIAITIPGNTTPNSNCLTPNGAIGISPSPTGAYTYAWSNGETTEDLQNLAEGSYTVTVSAGGNCSASASFVVTGSSSPPVLGALSSPSNCGLENGAIALTVTPSGGNTFIWSIGETTEDLDLILAGNYTVTVTNSSGCTATMASSVSNNDIAISLSGSATPLTSCISPNGAIQISPSPSGAYTYVWSNGETTEDLQDLAEGSYTVTVSAGGNCTASASFTVGDNTNPPLITAIPAPSNCDLENGAIALTITPSGGNTFLWSNGETTEDLNLILAGSYTVTVTNSSGCTATLASSVTNNDIAISLTGSASALTSCFLSNGAIQISPSPSGVYTYIWSNGETAEDLQNLAEGSYTVTVSAGGNCTASASFTVGDNTNPPVLSAISTPSNCNLEDGAIALTVTPGGGNTFIWSNGTTTEDLDLILAGNYTVTVTNSNGCSSSITVTVDNNSAPFTLSATTTANTSCTLPNGAVDLSVSIAGSFSFSWSNSASTEDLTGLAPGDYTVTATGANGCTSTASVTIDNNSAPFTLSAAVTANTSCSLPNGAVDLSVSIAGSYNFSWSNSASTEDLSGLAPGDYTVTATGVNGCTSTASVTIDNNSAPFTLSAAVTANTSCDLPNGAVDLSVSVAGSYSFSWSNSASTEDLSGLAPGIYSVTTTGANGCTSTASVTIDNNSAPFTLSAAVTANTSCSLPNGAVDLSVSIAGSFSFSWSNSASTEDLSGLSPGDYTVTATGANGCTSTASVTIDNNSAPFTLSAAVTANTSCSLPNGAVDLSVSIAGSFSFSWSNSASTEDLSGLSPGDYTVTATGANGCTSTASVTIDNNSAPFTLSAAVTANTSCSLPNGAVDLSVSIAGSFSFSWSNSASTEDLSGLAPGDYTVTATGVNGCTSTASVTIDNNSAPFTLSAAVTANTSCTLPNGAVDLSVSIAGSFGFSWSNSASTEDLSGLAPGDYTVTVTGANGCTSTTLVTIGNNSTPFSLSAAVTANTSCTLPNGAVDLSVSIAGSFSFSWSNSASTEDLSGLAPGDYTVTVTGANGCTSTASVTIDNNSAPFTLSAAMTANTSCSLPNGAVDLSVSVAGSYGFSWSNSASTEDLSGLAPGIYSVTATGANGCTSTASVTIDNNSAPFTLSAAVTANTSCDLPNGAVDLSVSVAGSYSFSWSNSASTEDLSGLAPGDYTVTVTGANGCTSTASVTIDNNSAPFTLSAAVTANTSCSLPNGAVDLSVSVAGSYSFSWSNSASTEDLTGLAPGIYSVTATGANGCTSTASVTIDNNSAPFTLSAAVTANTSCSLPNGAVDLSVSVAGSYSFSWSNSASTEDLTGLAPGVYSVTATGANGCTSTASVTIDNNSAPFTMSATATGNTSCSLPNGAVDLSVSIAGSYSFSWSNSASTEDLTGLAPGVYTVTATGANGCTSSTSINVDAILNTPSIQLTVIDETCVQQNGAINLAVTGGNAPYTYQWSNGQMQANLSNTSTGTYTVTVTDALGCTQSGTALVGNLSVGYTLSASTTNNQSCTAPNGSIDLSVSTAGVYSYLWSNQATSQDLIGLAAGSYMVTVTDPTGCSASSTYEIIEGMQVPEINVETTPTGCDAPSGTIQINLINGGVPPLSYSINGGQQFSESAWFDHLPPGNYQVMVEDANHCVDALAVQIPTPLQPSISPIPPINLTLGETLTLNVELQPGFPLSDIDTVIWTPATGLTFTDTSVQALLNPSMQALGNQSYTVEVISKQGCFDVANLQVKVEGTRSLYHPNVIWPEGSNSENTGFTLYTKPETAKEILVLKVYDRWGEEVFSRTHFEPNIPSLGWQGDFRGQLMNPAVFVWWAEVEWLDGSRNIYKGDVTVFR